MTISIVIEVFCFFALVCGIWGIIEWHKRVEAWTYESVDYWGCLALGWCSGMVMAISIIALIVNTDIIFYLLTK